MANKFEHDNAEVSRLREIQQEILTLLDEAEGIVTRCAPIMTAARAKSYWIPGVKIALLKEHDYAASSMCCMDDTIREMADSMNSDDEDEHDDTDDSED